LALQSVSILDWEPSEL